MINHYTKVYRKQIFICSYAYKATFSGIILALSNHKECVLHTKLFMFSDSIFHYLFTFDQKTVVIFSNTKQKKKKIRGKSRVWKE